MKQLKPSTQFRKDYKKIANNPQKIAAFKRIANYLTNDTLLVFSASISVWEGGGIEVAKHLLPIRKWVLKGN